MHTWPTQSTHPVLLSAGQDPLKTHNRHQGDGQKDSEQELCPSRAITLPLRNPSSTDSCCQLASRGAERSCQCTVVRTFWNWALGRQACRAPLPSRTDCYCQVQRAWKRQFYSTGIPITFTGARLPGLVHSCHAGCLSSHCFCPSGFFISPLSSQLSQNRRWTGRAIWLAGRSLNELAKSVPAGKQTAARSERFQNDPAPDGGQ